MSDEIICPRCGKEDRQGRRIVGTVNGHQEVWLNPFVTVMVDCPECGLVEENYPISRYTVNADLVTPRKSLVRPEVSFRLEIQELQDGVILVQEERPA